MAAFRGSASTPARSRSLYSEESSTGEGSTQARLMRRRGDLFKTAYSFDASLPPAGPTAGAKGLGMEIGRAGQSKLFVAEVDRYISSAGHATPVAEWNEREERQAHRGEQEHHASLAIRPGDKICAVNDMQDDDEAMADLLASAASMSSPKAVRLKLERSRSDVLGPDFMPLSPKKRSLHRPPTRGVVDSIGRRSRTSPDLRPSTSQSTSTPNDLAGIRRSSDPALSSIGMNQWQSMFSATSSLSPPQSRRPHTKLMDSDSLEDDVSTRAGSKSSTRPPSSSGRSSSASFCDVDPPVIIKSQHPSSSFSRVGMSTLRCR